MLPEAELYQKINKELSKPEHAGLVDSGDTVALAAALSAVRDDLTCQSENLTHVEIINAIEVDEYSALDATQHDLLQRFICMAKDGGLALIDHKGASAHDKIAALAAQILGAVAPVTVGNFNALLTRKCSFAEYIGHGKEITYYEVARAKGW